MIGKAVTLFLLLGASVTYATEPTDKPFQGIDPNTLACDPRGEIFLLLPHFTDCDRFFMCAHGNEVDMPCAPGTTFDFELQGCNWSRDTICWLRTHPEDLDVEGSGEEEFAWLADRADNPFDDSINSLTANTVMDSVRPMSLETPLKSIHFSSVLNCLRMDTAAKRVPYQSDCQRYWRCVDGVPRVSYCSDGLFFNERTQQCDFEANVKCNVEAVDELRGEFMVYK